MGHSKEELVQAFPLALREDALAAVSVLSENRFSSRLKTFPLRLGTETICIPYRLYYDPPFLQTLRLSRTKSGILDCLFTRHHDGFVRQKHLARIIRAQDAWIPCYVFPMIGEYVVEILQLIHENLPNLKPSIYVDFIRANPEYFALTEQRVISYWDCYYRSIKREVYPGFILLDFFKSIVKDRKL